MGLFDQMAGALTSNTADGENSPLCSILELVNNPQTGGLSGLVGTFQQGGLSDVVGSWVSTGQNLPISADQLKNVLGSQTIGNLATRMGVSHDEASGNLAQFLPQVVDKLTPDGQIPEGDLMTKGLELFKSFGG